jgi:uncharacterized surface protein with fasciclin (FAS1) repeats
MRVTKRTSFAALAIAIAGFGLAGCSTAMDETAAPSTAPTEEAMEMDYTADLVGTSCAAYAEEVPTGPGSIDGMATELVTVAASNNPLLTTLVAAVSGQLNPDVNLVSTLDGAEFTIFAPVDDAFAKLPAETVEALKLPENAALLSSILTYHVVPGQILPSALSGDVATVQGGTVSVTGMGDSLKINDAAVICGGVRTANATVYLIDGVLTPPAS